MELTEDVARRSLIEACRHVGIGSPAVELIRMGSNAVFRIDSDFIGRVGAGSGSRDNAARQVAVARWLASVGFPVNRALPVDQPVEGDGIAVTFWESVSCETVYAPIADVALVIKQLHDLPAPVGLELPTLAPFGLTTDPLPVFPGIGEDEARFLRSRIAWAREAFPKLRFVLAPGVIHGDANVGNVLVGKDGRPVVIDLDNFAVGPREWDLIQTALFYDRLGWHTLDEYRTFVDIYGYDIIRWSGYPDLADMREIAMTSWLSRKAESSSSVAAEATKRIRAIASGASRRDWGAY